MKIYNVTDQNCSSGGAFGVNLLSVIYDLPLARPSVAEMLRSRIATKYILSQIIKTECKLIEVQVHFIYLVTQKCVRIQ